MGPLRVSVSHAALNKQIPEASKAVEILFKPCSQVRTVTEMHTFLAVAFLALSELCAVHPWDGSPYTLEQLATRPRPRVSFPWFVLIKTPRNKCVGTILRADDSHKTPLVLAPSECLLTADISVNDTSQGQNETRLEIPSMVEIVGSNFSSVAKNLYLSVKTGYPVVFIKLEEPYRGPTVLVDRAVYFTGNVTKCILVRFSSSETQKRQLLSNDDSPVRFREEEEICRNSTASETGILDGQGLTCKAGDGLWTFYGFCGEEGFESIYVPVQPLIKLITYAAREMELYKKDEVLKGRKISYKHSFLHGQEVWTVTRGRQTKIYYREPVL